MERRVILAILLMLIVAVLPSILFPPKKTASRLGGQADSNRTSRESRPAPVATPQPPSVHPPNRVTAALAETVWVTSPLYRLGFSTRGGALVIAELLDYKSYAPADSGRPVQPFNFSRISSSRSGHTL